MQTGLFDCALPTAERRELLSEGAMLLRGFGIAEEMGLMEGVRQVLASAPFRHMITPGGQKMSVAMTNCGLAGWVSDRRGYRYDSIDPVSGHTWPPMPAPFFRVAQNAAAETGFSDFTPDVCLINRYQPGTRLSLHQDKDERDFSAPIVSISLGLPATFLFGGITRSERPRRIRLESGDVVVWGGPARLTYHGIAPLADGDHPLTGRCRITLTFRKAL
jgi:alkylated DNA repair protein (DNA oxidative demethylase)